MTQMRQAPPLLKRLLWFALLWLAGVVAVAGVVGLVKLAMPVWAA